MSLVDQIKFDSKGLIPAIIRDAVSGDVLMLTYMNAEAVEKTVQTGKIHYWSRSRRRLRMKGNRSGHVQRVREIRLDCDADCLLVAVEAAGAACHTGQHSCFHRVWRGESGDAPGEAEGMPTTAGEEHILDALYRVVQERRRHPAANSYVASLFDKGLDKILAKIGEEATETAVAGKGGDAEQVVYETADLFFHVLLLLAYYDLPPARVHAELRRRFGLSGLAEKASRGK